MKRLRLISRKATLWPADRVERRPIGELITAATNAREHSEAQVAAIAGNMMAVGWTVAVLTDAKTGDLIAGHGRILAAALLIKSGHKKFYRAPVNPVSGWSETKKRAYRIADNKLALMATWDETTLLRELTELDGEGALALTGFTEDELTALGDVARPWAMRRPTRPRKRSR